MRWPITLISLWAAGIAALSSSGNRLLVVFDAADARSHYTTFLADLSSRGFELTLRDAKSSDAGLFEFGERLFDHVMIAPEQVKGLGPSMTPQILLSFAEAGGNILLAFSSTVPEGIRDLARELDMNLAPRDTSVVDHFSYDALSAADKHDVVLVETADGLVAYRGIGHTLRQSPMVEPVLVAGRTGYSYDRKEEFAAVEDPWSAGSQLFLVSRFQANNNARIAVAGSLDMFSDNFFTMTVQKQQTKEQTANRLFVRDLTKWVFAETGVLRVLDVKHEQPGSNTLDQSIYRIKSNVTYSVNISQYADDAWKPVLLTDLQLELTMLDPYYRITLAPVADGDAHAAHTTYRAEFRLPDQHGVFTFNLAYRRPGWTYMEDKRTVTLRHFAHNEFARSYDISSALPWITSVGVVCIGWVLFCALWLYDKERTPTVDSTKKVQ